MLSRCYQAFQTTKDLKGISYQSQGPSVQKPGNYGRRYALPYYLPISPSTGNTSRVRDVILRER